MDFETYFLSSDFLENGNPKQKRLHRDLSEHKILERISKFDPVLAGTIPLDIDHPASDADILCCFKTPEEFSSVLESAFSDFLNFELKEGQHQGIPSVLARFQTKEFSYEVFGQNLPIVEQMGFVHLQVEHKILCIAGENFKNRIRVLKNEGWKTEPAFAHLLGIQESPYHALYDMRLFSDQDLRNFVFSSEFFSNSDK
ncbi:DUF4269 domain-containing protein [Leptospira barantonii]|uniref:DUF4269 domain-containing protein n=1 Tax=Leptospira barantonii TaxID=2023184 RepID=A0ABX4NHA1_9LEPT|nr:DUF4269 domain-containing protein [Leptospira barantonii]PJZ56175.1 hypothetical protein CH367_15015 [Leptospira barantonii]